jgi:hypothetical protein
MTKTKLHAFGLITVIAIGAFILAALIGGTAVYSTKSSFCGSCKIMQTRYVAWERSTHARSVHAATADCIDCHSEPGAIGNFKAHLNGARYVLVRLTGGAGRAILQGKVYMSACTECHTVRGIVVKQPGHEINHAAHIAHSIECFQCHRNPSHGTLLGEPTLHAMDTCESCHTQQQYQMARCTACHSRSMINNLFLSRH